MSNKIIILTGEIQTGKTSLLQQFCLKQNNIAGVLTPIVNGKRMFYNILEKEFFKMEAAADESTLAIGKYLFSAAAFTKANAVIADASKNIELKYLIIDEIGPLETKKHQGLYQSLKKITATSFNYTLIIVVRSSLVNDVKAVFNLINPLEFSLDTMKEFVESTS